MTRLSGTLTLTLSVAAFLAALSLVAWRQGRARSVMVDRERVREEIALETEVRAELLGKIRYLESRRRVVRDAGERLGMRVPESADLLHLPVADR